MIVSLLGILETERKDVSEYAQITNSVFLLWNGTFSHIWIWGKKTWVIICNDKTCHRDSLSSWNRKLKRMVGGASISWFKEEGDLRQVGSRHYKLCPCSWSQFKLNVLILPVLTWALLSKDAGEHFLLYPGDVLCQSQTRNQIPRLCYR